MGLRQRCDISFGGRVHDSAIVHFIDQRPYVDSVHDFTMYLDGVRVREAVAQNTRSILVAAQDHEIEVMSSAESNPGGQT